MMSEDWLRLLPRLEQDLRSRARGDADGRDESAWREAAGLIKVFARLMVRDSDGSAWLDPDDLAQTVLMKLQSADALRRLQSTRAPAGYIAAMVRNARNDAYRQKTSRREGSLEVTFGEDLAVLGIGEVDFATPERSLLLRRALRALNADDRQLLAMRFWQDLSIAEIAAKTGLSYSACAVRLFRILKRLRSRLDSAR